MSPLVEFLAKNTVQPEHGGEWDEITHEVVDLVFFKAAVKRDVDKEALKELISQQKGSFCEIDPFDGAEHGFIEVGAWVGSQQVALFLMAVGKVAGLWDLLTPYSILGEHTEKSLAEMLAGQGMVTIKAPLPAGHEDPNLFLASGVMTGEKGQRIVRMLNVSGKRDDLYINNDETSKEFHSEAGQIEVGTNLVIPPK